jgi:hypothetical protein
MPTINKHQQELISAAHELQRAELSHNEALDKFQRLYDDVGKAVLPIKTSSPTHATRTIKPAKSPKQNGSDNTHFHKTKPKDEILALLLSEADRQWPFIDVVTCLKHIRPGTIQAALTSLLQSKKITKPARATWQAVSQNTVDTTMAVNA